MQKDAYTLILEAIEAGLYKPGDRLVESEMAERLGVSRTPVREALQRLETQSMLTRDGRSLIVASLDHNQLAELYIVRTELEGLAARLAARHAADEEVRVLRGMVEDDRKLVGGDLGTPTTHYDPPATPRLPAPSREGEEPPQHPPEGYSYGKPKPARVAGTQITVLLGKNGQVGWELQRALAPLGEVMTTT